MNIGDKTTDYSNKEKIELKDYEQHIKDSAMSNIVTNYHLNEVLTLHNVLNIEVITSMFSSILRSAICYVMEGKKDQISECKSVLSNVLKEALNMIAFMEDEKEMEQKKMNEKQH